MSRVAQDVHLPEGFLAEDRKLRLRMSKIAHIIAIAAVLGGTVLDAFVYPERQALFLRWRLGADLVMALALVLHFVGWGKRNVRGLSMFWVLFMNAFLSILIYQADGAASPYYAGINLVLLGVAVLLPFTMWETIIACIGAVVCYVWACLAHAHGADQAIDGRLFFNNFFFFFVTILICVVSSHVSSRARFRDYDLRHQLDARNQKLEELDRLKSQFFANISHELRTPLTLILSPVQDLLHQAHDLDDRTRHGLEMVRDNALRLLRLINDLLEIVRLEGGRLELHTEPVDLATYVPGIVDSVRHLAESKGLHVAVEGKHDPLMVMADPSRLEKVLLNLLTNAIKFTPSGGTITARWGRGSQNAHVEISDTGMGIPAVELPHVFDRFRQVDGTATRKFQGAGLGLALARELIEEHGGKLTVQSEEGQGACFAMTMPLETSVAAASSHRPHWQDAHETDPIARVMSQSKEASVAVPLERETPEAVPEGPAEAPTVLVVDDEPDMRRFLVSILCQNYRVLEAEDGPAGVQQAMTHHPDLILLDMMLPGMTGMEVCKKLKTDGQTADTKIILLTARADEETKIQALELGADDFLTKPFSSLEVRTRMQNLLESARLQRDLRDRNVALELTLAQLRSTESQLVQSEKMNALGNLAAGLLHEINNPLNYTMTALQLIQETETINDSLQDGLKDIDEGMGRIRDIVTDLRAFAYPEQVGQQEPVSLSEAIETALRFTSKQCEGLQVESQVSEEAVVYCSKSHIVQVLVNLIANAADAMNARPDPESKLQILVNALGPRVDVGVVDGGVGIASENLSKVFDPFFTTKDVGEGMGLGLSVCHTIVQNHGGSIRIESVPGRGTEVWFDLPLAEAVANENSGEFG